MTPLTIPRDSLGAECPTMADSVPSGQGERLSDKGELASRYLTDGERELQIGKHGSLMLHFMAEWDAHGNFSDRGAAERHLMLMADLIKGRSPAQVLKMERERRLA